VVFIPLPKEFFPNLLILPAISLLVFPLIHEVFLPPQLLEFPCLIVLLHLLLVVFSRLLVVISPLTNGFIPQTPFLSLLSVAFIPLPTEFFPNLLIFPSIPLLVLQKIQKVFLPPQLLEFPLLIVLLHLLLVVFPLLLVVFPLILVVSPLLLVQLVFSLLTLPLPKVFILPL